MLHGSHSELYLANNLRSLDHSFENATEIPDVQTNPLRLIHYPQGRDDLTKDHSVVRSTGSLFQEFFKDLNILVPTLIKFVLKHGDHNVARDGELKRDNCNVADDADGDRDPKVHQRPFNVIK